MDSYIGEIRMFGGNFAPQGWALCNGQLLPISGNETVYTLLGTTYGGDGVNNFGLPDLRGRVPIHMGTGLGLSLRQLGEMSGSETVTLVTSQIPTHTHPLLASSDPASSNTPVGNLTGTSSGTFYGSTTPLVALNPSAISNAGGSQPHDNLQPFLCVNFIISLSGIFPSQS